MSVKVPYERKKFHVLTNKMLPRMKKAAFALGSINLVAMEKIKTVATLCVPDVREILCCILFVVSFTGSKDTEPYKSDVSFLCQYIYNIIMIVQFSYHLAFKFACFLDIWN